MKKRALLLFLWYWKQHSLNRSKKSSVSCEKTHTKPQNSFHVVQSEFRKTAWMVIQYTLSVNNKKKKNQNWARSRGEQFISKCGEHNNQTGGGTHRNANFESSLGSFSTVLSTDLQLSGWRRQIRKDYLIGIWSRGLSEGHTQEEQPGAARKLHPIQTGHQDV